MRQDFRFFLPLFHPMEERVGERRRVLIPLSSILSPLVPRGERKKTCAVAHMCKY